MPAEFSELSRSQRIRYYTANLFLRALIGGFKLLPYKMRIPAMGWLVAHVMAPLAGFNRRVRDNLNLTCPELDDAEVQRLCRAVCDNAGRSLIEFYSGQEFIDRARSAEIGGPGLAALQEARDAGRPVILMTGHFGNYDAARAKLISLGFGMGGLYRRMANPYFNEHYRKMLATIGTPMFEQGRRGMIEMVRHLKQGGIIAIVGDLHVQEGIELDFFGQPAITSTVPAELAIKQDAAMIPAYAIRQPDGLNFRIEMHEPIAHSDPATMTQQLNDDLEALVRQHMDQWFWIHRRWKPA